MYLEFDIGGSNIRVGVSLDGQNITASKIVPLTQDFEQGIQALKQTANELSGGEKIEAVGGGIAGILDKEKTMLVSSSHVSGWINKPLKSELEELFNCLIYLENDAALGALGEATKGPGAKYKIVGYVAIGTGVGGARIVNGRIDENALGFEPGHQIIVTDGDQCNCGGKGHLETYVGGFYLQRKYNQKGEEIKDPVIWDEVAKYLAIGLYNTIVHWSPEIIILGGAVTQSMPLESVNRYLKQFCTVFPQPPQVVKATLGHDAGLYGALVLLGD